MERVRGKKCTFSTLSSSPSLLIKHFMGRDAICRHPISESLCHKNCLELWNREKNRLEKFTSRMQACCIFDCVVYRCYRKAFIACKQPRRWRRGRVPLLRMRYMHFADSAQPAPHTYGAIWKCKISSEIWTNPDIIFCPDSLTLDRPWFFHQLLGNAISIFAILIRFASSGQNTMVLASLIS